MDILDEKFNKKKRRKTNKSKRVEYRIELTRAF